MKKNIKKKKRRVHKEKKFKLPVHMYDFSKKIEKKKNKIKNI